MLTINEFRRCVAFSLIPGLALSQLSLSPGPPRRCVRFLVSPLSFLVAAVGCLSIVQMFILSSLVCWRHSNLLLWVLPPPLCVYIVYVSRGYIGLSNYWGNGAFPSQSGRPTPSHFELRRWNVVVASYSRQSGFQLTLYAQGCYYAHTTFRCIPS